MKYECFIFIKSSIKKKNSYIHYLHNTHFIIQTFQEVMNATCCSSYGTSVSGTWMGQTKGKKKSNGSLASMVGVALYPGRAFAETGMKATELLTDRMLLPPDNKACGRRHTVSVLLYFSVLEPNIRRVVY